MSNNDAQQSQTSAQADRWLNLLERKMHVDEGEYSDWARSLAHHYVLQARAGDLLQGRQAGYLYEYLLSPKNSFPLFEKYGSSADLARVSKLSKKPKEAYRYYEQAELFIRASLQAEKAGLFKEALHLLEIKLSRNQRKAQAKGDLNILKERAFLALNASRIALKQEAKQRNIRPKSADKRESAQKSAKLLDLAMRSLEELAYLFEEQNVLNEAFIAYACLIELGRIEKCYENSAEGYFNCIRILKKHGDRFNCIRYYYDFIQFSLTAGEQHSAAELYREAAEYALRNGFIYAHFFTLQEAESWLQIALTGIEQESPLNLVENALLNAISAFQKIVRNSETAECYRLLSSLDFDDAKQKRYQNMYSSLMKNTEDFDDFTSQSPKETVEIYQLPQFFKKKIECTKFWIDDLLIAERDHLPVSALSEILSDHQQTWEVTRRRALVFLLKYPKESLGDILMDSQCLQEFCQIGHPFILSSLFHIYKQSAVKEQIFLIEQLKSFKDPKIFEIINEAYQSKRFKQAELQKVDKLLEKLNFAAALKPLIQMYSKQTVKRQAFLLSCIIKIGSDESVEFAIDCLKNTPSPKQKKNIEEMLDFHLRESMLSAFERHYRYEVNPKLAIFYKHCINKIREQREY